jgi:hypothetical protein
MPSPDRLTPPPAPPQPMRCGYCHAPVRADGHGNYFHTGVPADIATITRWAEPAR